MTNINNNIFPPKFNLIYYIIILSKITINVKYSILIFTIYMVNVINVLKIIFFEK